MQDCRKLVAAACVSDISISLLAPEWTLPSLLDDNPMAWMISVDGFIVDARRAPREIQEIAYLKGLIPYIPGEKPE